jgi:hypothetical protein
VWEEKRGKGGVEDGERGKWLRDGRIEVGKREGTVEDGERERLRVEDGEKERIRVRVGKGKGRLRVGKGGWVKGGKRGKG